MISFRSFFNLFKQQSSSPDNSNEPLHLYVEQLSERVMLSGSVELNGSVLRVEGTSDDDQIFVSSESGQVRVTINDFDHGLFQVPSQSVLVSGLEGDDEIRIGYGIGRDAIVIGGDGDDTIITAEGNDRVLGGQGQDFINTGDGDDEIFGGGFNDQLFGGDGDDEIDGGTGHDVISGGNGNDNISASFGRDTVFGAAGDDWIRGGGGDDTLYGGEGADRLFGDSENDTLVGGEGADRLFGGSENDTLVGGAGNDALFGGSEDDTLSGGSGNDILDGSFGMTTYPAALAMTICSGAWLAAARRAMTRYWAMVVTTSLTAAPKMTC